jgi:hypothetical protein
MIIPTVRGAAWMHGFWISNLWGETEEKWASQKEGVSLVERRKQKNTQTGRPQKKPSEEKEGSAGMARSHASMADERRHASRSDRHYYPGTGPSLPKHGREDS